MIEAIGAVLGLMGITVVSVTGLAFVLFRAFSEKWLESKFNSELEANKHKHNAELENLRLEINKLFDRSVKLHAREFERLPEAWEKINKAMNATLFAISVYQRYPDLDRMI